jgi:glycosyltransferase involved in cell wall biosynthesis
MTDLTPEKPLVSVCIQTYQHVRFIRATIDGALMQKTTFPVEILIGEDESTDGTREICVEYANKHPDRIRLSLNERKNVIYINGKPTGRWNFLNNIKRARGKYIALLPGDDYWTSPDKLQKQVDFLEKNTDYSLCFHRVHILEGTKFTESYIPQDRVGTTTIIELARKNYIHTCSCLYRNHFPASFPQFFFSVPFLDYVSHMFISQYGKIMYFREKMAVYRVHEGGIYTAMNRQQQLANSLAMIEPLFDFFGHNPDVLHQLDKQRMEYLVQLMECYRETNDRDRMYDCFKALTCTNPGVFLEYFDDVRKDYVTLLQKYRRITAHPVAGEVIRLLARIKRDDDFGAP